ncbi:hypothetical protein [Qipengyuania atrilutea]|uniref:Uncharacterized protein n=1 Tax=Qipengyuania atrilutea TaxID=2744473 RepID=A0A850H1N4_9SPHN|nr:hypothetical protein [Actirhodobacter atriluteus]NVD45894.1 hypothetical protein [Actirhodobacter atriluteus]
MSTTSPIHRLGWAALFAISLTLFLALTLRVNAVKSEVRAMERQIVAIERETLLLETEFQTRASQRQLAAWNQLEFGYAAPRADQYLDNRREVAALGAPTAIGAPQPIRVAKAVVDDGDDGAIASLSRSVRETPLADRTASVTAAAGLLAMSNAAKASDMPREGTLDLAQRLGELAGPEKTFAERFAEAGQ